MSHAGTEYSRLAFDYVNAVEAFNCAVHTLLDSKGLFAFNQAMEAVNVGHIKCEDLRTRLHEERLRFAAVKNINALSDNTHAGPSPTRARRRMDSLSQDGRSNRRNDMR